MAIKVKAAGDGPATGMPKSLPPVKPAAPDEVSQVRAPTKAGYGMNGYEGRSSTSPGETVRSPLSLNMEAASDDEGLLDRIARLGVANSGDQVDLQSPQTRKVDASAYPTSFGHHPAAPGPKIPAKLGESAAPDPKDPNA
jgi:hypothetical protein